MLNSITLCSKLKKSDSTTGLDVWYKYIFKDIKYSQQKVTNVVGSDISMSQSYTILIPFTGIYLPYLDWKASAERDTKFTVSQGDVVFLGIELTDEITPTTIVRLRNQYEPNVCEVRSIDEVPQKCGATIQLRLSGV
jgi:hypothetical protein